MAEREIERWVYINGRRVPIFKKDPTKQTRKKVKAKRSSRADMIYKSYKALMDDLLECAEDIAHGTRGFYGLSDNALDALYNRFDRMMERTEKLDARAEKTGDKELLRKIKMLHRDYDNRTGDELFQDYDDLEDGD